MSELQELRDRVVQLTLERNRLAKDLYQCFNMLEAKLAENAELRAVLDRYFEEWSHP